MLTIDNLNLEYQPLIDINSNGKVTDWQGKKLRTIELADSYRRLGEEFKSKQYRVRDCGTFWNLKGLLMIIQLNLIKLIFVKLDCVQCVPGEGH